MSHVRIKAKYFSEGMYGETTEHTLYADHNNCFDVVTIFDQYGVAIISYRDTIKGNIIEAINKLNDYYDDKSHNKLVEGVERMSSKRLP